MIAYQIVRLLKIQLTKWHFSCLDNGSYFRVLHNGALTSFNHRSVPEIVQ